MPVNKKSLISNSASAESTAKSSPAAKISGPISSGNMTTTKAAALRTTKAPVGLKTTKAAGLRTTKAANLKTTMARPGV